MAIGKNVFEDYYDEGYAKVGMSRFSFSFSEPLPLGICREYANQGCSGNLPV